MSAQFLSIKKLKGKGIIQLAAKHNLREIQAEYGVNSDGKIDPERVALNIVLSGADTASGVVGEAQRLMTAAGIKSLRKDAVVGLEVLASLPPNSDINENKYFNDFVLWAESYFEAPILSAIVHNDETAPHCHILLLPLIDGRMAGSDLMGGKTKLQDMHADFYKQVGQHYGLKRQAPQKRHSAAIRKQAVDLAFDALQVNGGLNDAVLRVLVDAHLANPEPLMNVLGLRMPESKPKKSFVEIMTKPCKPENPIGFESKKPVGFKGNFIGINETQKEQTLSSVGFRSAEPVISPSSPPPNPLNQAPPEQDYIEHITRFSDNDQQASGWDYETGQYRGGKPMQKMSNSQVAKNSVNLLLKNISNRTGINRHLII